ALASYSLLSRTATTEIYTLSLHDALPISTCSRSATCRRSTANKCRRMPTRAQPPRSARPPTPEAEQALGCRPWDAGLGAIFSFRSEEHTSELQSRENLVCRLLLEKKKTP